MPELEAVISMMRAALHFKFTHLKWNRPLSISSLQCSGCSAVREAFNFKIACASFCPGNRLFSYLCLSVMAMLSLRARGTAPGARVHRGNCPPCTFRFSSPLIHPLHFPNSPKSTFAEPGKCFRCKTAGYLLLYMYIQQKIGVSICKVK